MKERIAIVSGYRTPFLRAATDFKDLDADDLAAFVLKQLMLLSGMATSSVDEVILGNVAQPSKAANVSRVAALKAGFEDFVPAIQCREIVRQVWRVCRLLLIKF